MKAASLNHVYRLVWSKLQQAWVAVAETARAHGKSSVTGQVGALDAPTVSSLGRMSLTSPTKWRFLVACALAAAIAPLSSFADTNEIAGVIAGDLTVKDISSTHTQYIHTANVSIVDFYKFGVLKGNQLDVIMPDAGKALYRVIGNSRSEIMGTLNSNGSLFLINQNGVLFGQGSEVNVGNIVASSMDISNDDFLKGNYHFVAGSILGSVENHGVIKAKNEGYIVLLANSVNNSGTLVANNGSVVLGSAQEATLDFFGNGLVKAKLSGDALEATIKNSGLIQADGGLVQLATNARSAAINISGIVEANQLVERDGMIRLEGGDNAKVQVSGQLIAQGQNTTGGTIEVTGEQVALMSGALLDASGDKGGGTVLVGGDYQGKNDAVYNSRTAYVSSGATIKADAIQQGDGGKVIVWSNDLTRYYGSISAQGAATAGNGGFVEVSGKQNLDFDGVVNVAAINGVGGTVLLDPENIILTNYQLPGGLTDQPTGTADIAFADHSGETFYINVTKVNGFKELFLQATNNITVDKALTMIPLPNQDAGGSVRLEANNNININANITSAKLGYVILKADADNSGVGDINIGANITGGSGGVTLSAVNVINTANGAVSINATRNSAAIGDVTITTTGSVSLGNTSISGANVNINSAADITMLGLITATGGNVDLNADKGNVSVGAITALKGASTDEGATEKTGKIFVFAGRDATDLDSSNKSDNGNITMNGNISTYNTSADAVQLVAEGNFKNSNDTNGITTGEGGNWTIYSYDPTNDTKGKQLLDTYDYKQYGTTYGETLLGTGNGFVHAVSPTITATLTGSANKVFDGNNTVTDLTGLSVTTSGAIDGDKVTIGPITTATYDNEQVGVDKPINGTFDVTSIRTAEDKPIYYGGNQAPINMARAESEVVSSGKLDGYSIIIGESTARGDITATPATTTGFASPRDDAGLGGLIGNNPALNTMTIVSLNPAAGDEEDLDAVACPANEDSLGSTPILNSGVKLPDGVSSNCI